MRIWADVVFHRLLLSKTSASGNPWQFFQVQAPKMPRKKPVRTLAQISVANAKHYAKRAKTLSRVIDSSFVAALSERYFRRYANRIRLSSPSERKALVRLMPQYETVVDSADKIRNPFRQRFEQRARARKPRKYKAYPIGPKTSDGTRRLPLVLNAFIEGHARASTGLARNAWNELGPALETNAARVELHEDAENPRADAYSFTLCGDEHSFKFGQFEKIFTRSRKPRKANG
jgi:hypothetical protein